MFGFGRNTTDATIRFNADTSQAKSGLKSLQTAIGTVVSAYAIKQVYDFTKALVKAGDEDKRMAKSFEVMTQKISVSADKMLSDMNRVTHRVVQDANLQALAIRGIAQGFSKNEIVALMELASNFALSTGEDIEQSITQIFEAGPRGAAMAMKRMGMDIEMVNGQIKLDLDEMRKKSAQLGDAIGNPENSPVITAQQLAKNLEEAKGKLGQLIAPPILAGLKELNFWLGAAMGEDSALGSKRLDKTREKVNGIINDIVSKNKKGIEEIDKILADNKGKDKMPLAEGLGDYWLDIGGKKYDEAAKILLEKRQKLTEQISKLQPATIDPTGTTKPDGDGNKKLKPSATDDEAAKAAADAAKKTATDAANAAAAAREHVMKRTLDGRLQLIDEQEAAEFELLSQAKITNEEAYQNIQKKYGDLRMQEIQAEQDQINAFAKEEGQKQLSEFEKGEERKKEAEDKARQDRLERIQLEAQQTAEIRYHMYVALSASSDAFTNYEIINLKRNARSQEEYDKKLAEIQRRAANRQYAIALGQKAIALAGSIIDASRAAAGAAANTPGGVATKILAAIATAAEMAVIIGNLVATNVPAPKFRTGRLGKERRGGFGDTEAAFIDPAETIVPATQSAMHREELRAIMNNTANTASGLRKMKNGSTIINYYSVPVEQLLQAQVQTQRRNAIGTRI